MSQKIFPALGFKTILDSSVQEYSALKKPAQQKQFIKQLEKALKKAAPKLKLQVPENLYGLCKKYMDENPKPAEEDQAAGGKPSGSGDPKSAEKDAQAPAGEEEDNGGEWRPKAWTGHSVFVQKNKERINKATDERSGGEVRGTPPWLAHYQICCAGIKSTFSKKELKAFDALADTWNEKGPDKELQAELAARHLRPGLEKVVTYFKRQYNTSLGIVVMFKDKEGNTLVMKQSTKPTKGQLPFWKSGSMVSGLDEDALEWAKKEFGAEEEEESGEDEDPKAQKATRSGKAKGGKKGGQLLEVREDEHLGIPDSYTEWDHKQSKACIRSLVKHEWRLVVDRKTARTPWKEMVDNPSKYHDKDQVPEGFQWVDPEHLTHKQSKSLLKFWARRQDDDTPPFVFKESEEIQKSKAEAEARDKRARKLKAMKAAYVDVNEEDDGDGAPRRKKRKAAELSSDDEDEDQEGAPPPKHQDARKKKGKAKAAVPPEESEEEEAPPPKRRKAAVIESDDKEVEPKDASKEEATPKRNPHKTRGVGKKPAPPAKPASAPKSAPRRKNAPAAKKQTPAFANIAKEVFVQLSVPTPYQNLCSLLDNLENKMNSDTEMLKTGLPKWMGRGKAGERLPKTFHSGSKSADTLVKWLNSEPYRTGPPEKWLVSRDDWMFIAESVGRAYREVKAALEHEPGTPPPSVDSGLWATYASSKLSAPQLGALDTALAKMTKILATYNK